VTHRDSPCEKLRVYSTLVLRPLANSLARSFCIYTSVTCVYMGEIKVWGGAQSTKARRGHLHNSVVLVFQGEGKRRFAIERLCMCTRPALQQHFQRLVAPVLLTRWCGVLREYVIPLFASMSLLCVLALHVTSTSHGADKSIWETRH